MLRSAATNTGKQRETNALQLRDMKADLSARLDETNQRIDDTDRRFESSTGVPTP